MISSSVTSHYPRVQTLHINLIASVNSSLPPVAQKTSHCNGYLHTSEKEPIQSKKKTIFRAFAKTTMAKKQPDIRKHEQGSYLLYEFQPF